MVSVIIPVYNGEEYLASTIRSIAASTYSDLEIIIVDDGSKDTSAAIVKALKEQDDRIKYFYKTNGGIVSARNYGLEVASGDFICFADQDDIVKPKMYETLRNLINEENADFVQCEFTTFEYGEETAKASTSEKTTFIKGTKEYEAALRELIFRTAYPKISKNVGCSVWTKMFRKSFLDKNNMRFQTFLDYEDDWIMAIDAFSCAKKVCIIDTVLYVWRINRKSESHDRVVRDKYIESFYTKFDGLRTFLIKKYKETNPDERDESIFLGDLEKQLLLWGLSNETGRGIRDRNITVSIEIMKDILYAERKDGILKRILKTIFRPLLVSVYEKEGVIKLYCVFRDVFLSILIVFHMEALAVLLNKRVFHGRWHI